MSNMPLTDTDRALANIARDEAELINAAVDYRRSAQHDGYEAAKDAFLLRVLHDPFLVAITLSRLTKES